MDIYEFALLIGACIAAFICIHDRRALAWIGLGVTNFAATAWYYRHASAIPPSFVTGCTDCVTGLLILWLGRFRWEKWLLTVFQLMALTDLCMLAGLIPDQYTYAVALELLNWAALAIVGGTCGMERLDAWMGRQALGSGIGRSVHRAHLAARTPRQRGFFAKA